MHTTLSEQGQRKTWFFWGISACFGALRLKKRLQKRLQPILVYSVIFTVTMTVLMYISIKAHLEIWTQHASSICDQIFHFAIKQILANITFRTAGHR